MKFKNKATGIFRSQIEKRVSELLTEEGVEYEYEKVVITLLPSFVYGKAKIRPITYKPDFMDPTGLDWLIEVKGLETPDFKIKWKMLKHKLQQENNPLRLYLIKSLTELRKVIPELGQNKEILQQQSSIKLDVNKGRKPKVVPKDKGRANRLNSNQGRVRSRLPTN